MRGGGVKLGVRPGACAADEEPSGRLWSLRRADTLLDSRPSSLSRLGCSPVSFVGWFLLLLVIAVVGGAIAWHRQQSLPPPPVPYGDPHDLSTLGLTPARPRPVGVDLDDPDPYAESHGSRVPLPAVPGGPTRTPTTATARPVERPAPAAVPSSSARPRPPVTAPDSPWAAPAVAHLLASLAAHVGGTVAVVRHDGERHLIEARTDGSAMAPVDGPALALDGPMDLGPGALGALSSLVSGFAYAVPMGARILLIGGDGDGEGTARYLDLLDILGLGGAPTEPERGALPADDAGEDEVHMAEEGGTRPTPRAEIIAEEQRAAREADRPLAFALVTLADAEERLTTHPDEEVTLAEGDLRDRLEAAADVRRIEPFGDLLFGVFLDLDPARAATWCDRLASGEPPLFIGAVAPADGDPEGIRAAAVAALRDAYDQRRAHIVEA